MTPSHLTLIATKLLAALATALVTSCAEAPFDDPESFDVVVLVLDACRADRLGTYGYERPTTPVLDELAADAQSVVFERHYVAGNWTKPATASLFTGRWVHQHGVTNPHRKVAGRIYEAEILDDGFVTLAETLREAGYTTFGLVTSHHLAPVYGFAQGFDHYFDPESLGVGDAGRTEKLLDLVDGLDSPYFAYLHQNACHYPFRPEDRDDDFMAEHGFAYDEEERREAGIDFTTSEIRDAIVAGEVELTEDDQRFLSLVYDAKLRRVDREVVAPLIEGLRRIGRWDRTLLLVTADHGEELYEHAGYAHGFAMWEEVIHVPLVVKFPADRRPEGLPARVDTLTSNVDLYPSLLELLGVAPPAGLAGRPILRRPAAQGLVLSQGLTDRPEIGDVDWALLRGDEKVVVRRDGPTHFFDLGDDPTEGDDRTAAEPDRAAALLRLGEELRSLGVASEAATVDRELSPETIDTLRSLGYLR